MIGVGSSAVVRRGWDLHDGEAVAVKLFHPGASDHDRRQQRQEMTALTHLEHPGLVGLHDGGTEAGRPFVVTDLVEGPTLAERIKGGPTPPDEVRRLGALLADALAHVHAGGFVHRDIKPANVLLGDGTRPRLADFGISRALENTAATTAGCVVGTAAYLAPEQVRGERVGPPTDVYALGLVLIEALTGQREYPGAAVESATARLHRVPVVPDGLPDQLGPLLVSMTASDPAERPSAAEVAGVLARRPVAALVADAGGSSVLARGRGRRSRHRRPDSRRFATPLAAAVVLVLAVVAGALTLLSGPADPAIPVSTTADRPVADLPGTGVVGDREDRVVPIVRTG